MARLIPEQLAKQRADWWRAYVVWVTLQWTLSGVATVSAALAAAIPTYAAVFGVVAAGASALIGLGNPNRRAQSFMRAYRRLNNVCIACETQDTVLIDAPQKAHDEGEQIIEIAED